MRNAAIRHAGATYDIEGEYKFQFMDDEDLTSSEVLNKMSQLDPEDYGQVTIICDELDMEIFAAEGAWYIDGVTGPLSKEVGSGKGFYSLQDALEYVDKLVD